MLLRREEKYWSAWYCSPIVSNCIKQIALNHYGGKISMFQLQIIIASTYKNPKMVSREIKTTLSHFEIISHFCWTPSKLFRLNFKEDPERWGHSGGISARWWGLECKSWEDGRCKNIHTQCLCVRKSILSKLYLHRRQHRSECHYDQLDVSLTWL